MRRQILSGPVLVLILLLGVELGAQESRPAASAAVSKERLAGHIEALCSTEQGGRFGPGAEKTRAYLAKEFETLGLEPLAGGSFELAFAANGLKGANLAGRLAAGAEERLDGHVIISAHYDHLGRRGNRYYPGACDNASGVAAMLEIVRTIDRSRLRRDVIVVAFDLEERGMLGSFAWCERPPLPLEDCRFFITMDMLGRAGLGIVDGLLFAQGWEWTPEVLDDLQAAAKVDEEGELSYFWTDIAGDRSDFVPFKKKRIPHLFFSTGENEDYHQISDRPDRLDLPTLARQATVVGRVLIAQTEREEALVCRREPERHLIEFVSLRKLAGALMRADHPRMNTRTKASALLLYGFAAKVVARGEVKEKDRSFLRRVAAKLQTDMR